MDKPATKSKKFLAFLIVEIGFFIALGLEIWKENNNPLISIAIVCTIGFLAVGYILGQSYVDKYVNLASKFTGKGPSGDDESY